MKEKHHRPNDASSSFISPDRAAILPPESILAQFLQEATGLDGGHEAEEELELFLHGSIFIAGAQRWSSPNEDVHSAEPSPPAKLRDNNK